METAGTEDLTSVDPQPQLSLSEIKQRAAALGQEALVQIHQFLVRQTTVEQLSASLQKMEASTLLANHWDLLTGDREAAPVLEILHVIALLPEQAEFQVETYGASSLAEDRQQLASALARLEIGVK